VLRRERSIAALALAIAVSVRFSASAPARPVVAAIDEENEESGGEYQRAAADEQVQSVPWHVRLIGVDAAPFPLPSVRSRSPVPSAADLPAGRLKPLRQYMLVRSRSCSFMAWA